MRASSLSNLRIWNKKARGYHLLFFLIYVNTGVGVFDLLLIVILMLQSTNAKTRPLLVAGYDVKDLLSTSMLFMFLHFPLFGVLWQTFLSSFIYLLVFIYVFKDQITSVDYPW